MAGNHYRSGLWLDFLNLLDELCPIRVWQQNIQEDWVNFFSLEGLGASLPVTAVFT